MNIKFPTTPIERFAAKQPLPAQFDTLVGALDNYFSIENTAFADFLREAVDDHFGPFEDNLWDITQIEIQLLKPASPLGVYFEFIFEGVGWGFKFGAWLYFTNGRPQAINFIRLNPGETNYEDEPEDDFINSIAPVADDPVKITVTRPPTFKIYAPPPGGGGSTVSGQIENM